MSSRAGLEDVDEINQELCSDHSECREQVYSPMEGRHWTSQQSLYQRAGLSHASAGKLDAVIGCWWD